MNSATREEVQRIIADLKEHRKLKYIGDCKCGHCQLVPETLIDDAIEALGLAFKPEIEEEVLAVWVTPDQLGWSLVGKNDDGRNIWKTDDGEFYLFPRGQREALFVPRT